MRFKKQFNPFMDNLYIESNGKIFQLHWKYRFDPITMLAVAAIGGGTGLSTYATLKEGKEAAELSEISDLQYQAEAKATEQAGQYESREKRKQAERFKAMQIVQMAAQGGTLSGSNLILLADSAKEFEADARVIQRNAGLNAIKLRNAGAMASYEGKLVRQSSRIRAMGNVLNTAGTMYMMGKNFGGTPKTGAGYTTGLNSTSGGNNIF